MKTIILRIIFLILIIINSLIIFGFSSQNGQESGNLSKMVITKIADILNIKEENRIDFLNLGEKIIRKLAHFSIYTLLGIWSISFLHTFNIKLNYQVIITSIWGFLYAITDEFHQMFSSGRHASIDDVIIDTLGVIFGLLLVILVLKIKNRGGHMKEIIKERGITLVSLVVSVVILMILSGIIITTSSDNNGVLNIANNKKEETEIMTIEENIKTELQEDPPKTYAELINFLKNYGEVQNEEVPDEAILVTNKGNYKIYVKNIWNIDKEELEVSVGDYVEYTYDGGTYIVDDTYSGTNKEQTIQAPQNSDSIWRVIDVNKQSKQIKIIPIELNNIEVTLKGVNGFNNGVKILNDLCNNLFSNIQYNATARNINIEDVEKLCSNISILKGTLYGTEKEYSSLVRPEVLKEENDISIQNEFFDNFEIANNVKLIQTYYSGDIVYSSSSYGNLIPKGSYWISSRAINNSDNAEYYLRTLNIDNSVSLSGTKLFDSNEQVEENTFSAMPVVTLNNLTFDLGTGREDDPYRLEK